MTQYLVKWEIDIEADTPEDAARQALEIQRDPESKATCFEVSIPTLCWTYRKIVDLG